MSTDLPASELATFIDLAASGKPQKITSVAFVPPLVEPAYPDFTLIQDRVIQALIASRQEVPISPSGASVSGSSGSGSSASGSAGSGSTESSGLSGSAAGSASGASAGGSVGTSAGRSAPTPSSSAEAATAAPVDVAGACAPA
jgi:hypothetical protein